jgi:predicted nucleic acid-binding protein
VTLFVDTSALYALMDRDDRNHARATRFWSTVSVAEPLLTHNYVLVETSALVQRRLGMEALHVLVDELTLPISTVFVDQAVHAGGSDRRPGRSTSAIEPGRHGELRGDAHRRHTGRVRLR